ncbi:MAG TPA: SGNH/GDSL hydrolase family protein, partial [Rhodothermales bacterium]|nr:SGNH/GDSL hydrolase family protein [Rhodothermales bacterium]
MPQRVDSGMGTFVVLFLSIMSLFFAVLCLPALVSLIDPSPPLSETMIQSLHRAQVFFLGSAILFLGLFGLAWKTNAGRRFFDNNTVMNGLLVIGALLPFVAAEVAMRPMMRKTSKATIFVPDEELGWRLRPGIQAFFADTPVTINELGWRGALLPFHKPDSTFRILFLGDSVTFGHAVAEDSVLFPYRTGLYLSPMLDHPVETLNFGVPAYMTWQELLLLKRDGLRYEPDLVVLGFVLNDVAEKLDYSFWQEDKLRSLAAASWIARWSRRSALVWAAQVIGRRLRIGHIDLSAKQVDDVKRLIHEANASEIRQAWQDTFSTLDELEAFCEAHDLPVLLVAFPFTFQLKNPDDLNLPQQQLAMYA